ncbi:agmatinase [Methylocystis sp. IM3]|uniref:agmatinase n=1 Tax=unclassified Methylocystis TaxID=2625913 RepID=UPI0030FC7F3E
MTDAPTFAMRSTFLAAQRSDADAAVAVAGIPLDIGVSYRAGTRFGPEAIRRASAMLVGGGRPPHWIDPSALPIADVGNFEIALGDLTKSYELIEKQAGRYTHLVTLGGDHGITLPLLRALRTRHGPLGLVHFDAHVDTWRETFGQVYGHGTVFFHAIEEGLVDPGRMVQIGIRSPMPREVYEWTVGKGVTIVSAEEAQSSTPDNVARLVCETVGAGPVYLTSDVDALDPAFAPGTDTPEIGGLATWQAQAILRRLGSHAFVGMDVVEVSPPYDVSDITALVGATMAWEYLCLVAPILAGGR